MLKLFRLVCFVSLTAAAGCDSENARGKDTTAADSNGTAAIDTTVRGDSAIVPRELGAALRSCAGAGGVNEIGFQNLSTDAETKDVSGYLVVFTHSASDVWIAQGSQAYGELLPSLPLESLKYDSATASLTFSLVALRNPTKFDVTFTCDSLSGKMETMPGAAPRPVVLRRR